MMLKQRPDWPQSLSRSRANFIISHEAMLRGAPPDPGRERTRWGGVTPLPFISMLLLTIYLICSSLCVLLIAKSGENVIYKETGPTIFNLFGNLNVTSDSLVPFTPQPAMDNQAHGTSDALGPLVGRGDFCSPTAGAAQAAPRRHKNKRHQFRTNTCK